MKRSTKGDYELAYRIRTGKILKRRDACANRKRNGADKDCQSFAESGSVFCSGECHAEAKARDREKFVGGSIDGHIAEFERKNPHHRDQVGGTRHPRENSTHRDGLES